MAPRVFPALCADHFEGMHTARARTNVALVAVERSTVANGALGGGSPTVGVDPGTRLDLVLQLTTKSRNVPETETNADLTMRGRSRSTFLAAGRSRTGEDPARTPLPQPQFAATPDRHQ